MKIIGYTIILLCIFILNACKPKGKQTMREAINKESRSHSDTSNATTYSVSKDKAIIPGKSIGGTAINEAAANVMTQLGKPDFADAAMGKSVSVWYADHNKKGYATHIYCITNMGNDDTSRVMAVRVNSPSFKTANKLYTGVLISDAQKLYKLDTLGNFKLNGGNRTLYDDTRAGIAFDVDRGGTITGITVHQIGMNVKNVYTAFFGEVK